MKADDLEQICELGRGAYGVVDKMRHVPSDVIMAVKVGERNLESLLMLSRFPVRIHEVLLFSSADSGHGEHSGAEEASHGPGHLHEDSGLFLYSHLLRSAIPRGRLVFMFHQAYIFMLIKCSKRDQFIK